MERQLVAHPILGVPLAVSLAADVTGLRQIRQVLRQRSLGLEFQARGWKCRADLPFSRTASLFGRAGWRSAGGLGHRSFMTCNGSGIAANVSNELVSLLRLHQRGVNPLWKFPLRKG